MSVLGVPPPIKEEEKKKKPVTWVPFEYSGWKKLEEEGRMTPALQKLKEAGSAPPIEKPPKAPLGYKTVETAPGVFASVPIERLEQAPMQELPKVPEKDTLFEKVARFVLPESLELRLGLRKPTKAEEIRQWGKDVEEYYGRGEDIIGGIRTFGEGLIKLPKATAVAILQSTQGYEGASVVDKDWADRYIEDASKDLNKFIQETEEKYRSKLLVSGLPLKITDIAELPQNLAFSLTSMGAGLGVGVPIGLIPLPGARVTAWTLGTAASGKVAYEMTTYQITQQYLEAKNEEKIKETGKSLTLEEENQLKDEFGYLAAKYGLWEAIPEAISNLAFVKILTAPLLKMGVSKTVTGKILTKITGLYGEELLTETITQKGQSDIEIEAGLRERRISWTEAFKEIAPQTFLLTTVMAGSGSAIIQTQKGINKITDSLKNEIGTAHVLYDQLKIHIEETMAEIKERPEAGFVRLPGEPAEISKEQIDVARGFARKFVNLEITRDQFRKNLEKTFPNVEGAIIEDIEEQARVFKDQDLSVEEKVTSIGNYIEKVLKVEKPKVVKPEVKPVTPKEEAELSKIYQEQFEEIQTTGEKKLFTDITELGGMKTDPTLKEEMSDLPIDIIRKDGVMPDEMMDMLNERGYNLKSVSDLFDSIRDIRSMPTRFKPAETTLERNLRTVEAIRTKMPEVIEAERIATLEKEVRKLIREARVPGIPIKKVIRKVTVQVKPGLPEFTRRIRDWTRGLREGRITTKQEVRDVQTELLSRLDKSELELKDKAKFRKEIRDIQTKEQLQRELPKFQDRIETLLEASEVRTLKAQITTELKATKPIKQAGKPVGKFTPFIQKTLDGMREAVKMTKIQADDKIVENLNNYKKQSMPVEIALENSILNMRTKGAIGLRQILNNVKEIKFKGRVLSELQKFNIVEELDRKKKYLVDVVTDYKGIAEARQTTGVTIKAFKERAIQSLKSLGQEFVLSWRGLMQVLDWHTHVDKKTLADRYSVLDQENKYKELQEEYVNDFNKMFADVYDIPTKTLKDQIAFPIRVNKQILELKDEINLGTFVNTIGQKAEIRITRDEMVKRYMEFQDPTLYDSFREGNNYTFEIINAIRAELTSQEKELADKEIKLYKKQYDKINPIYKKMYGVDLPFNEFYSPIMREGYRIDLKEGFQTFLDEASLRKAVTSKSFITRIRNALPIAKQGSLEAMDRHITQTNYFIAWAEKVRELDNIFADPDVREVIREEFGNSLLRQVMKNIEDFGYNRRIRGQIHPAINWFRQKFTLGALMLKPALAAKQMVSTVAYVEKLSAAEFTAGTIDFWRNPVRNYRIMAKESVFIRTRGKQGEMERDIRAALRSDVYSRFSKLHNFWNMAMMNIRFGDKGAIITGAWAMRRARLAKGKDLGKTIKEYEEFSAETQQSADISQLSAVQKGGSFSVLFTMFKSSQRQYLAKEVNAVKTLFQKGGTSPKNIKKVARILAIYHFMLPIFFQWVANFGGWDEEDRKEYIRAGILGSLNGWFVAGDIIDGIIRKALDLKVWPQEVPIVSIGDDLQQFVGKIDLNNISAEDMKDALFELGDAGNALGIPVKYVINLYKSIIEILEGDIEEGLGLLLGWSEYVLKKEKKKKAPKGILGPPPPVAK